MQEQAAIPLLVVIVNYRTPELTIDCLASLASQAALVPGMHVAVVENGSGDDSATRIGDAIQQRGWCSWAKLYVSRDNTGFAGGNNWGLTHAQAEKGRARFVLLLNPDTIVRPGALNELMRFMESHPHVGIAGSRLEDPDGTPQHSAFRFHSIASEFEHGLRLGLVSRLLQRWVVAGPISDEPCATGWVAGASMMIRREVLDAIGLLDEGYFMYYEEVDFCLRAARAGWPCWYVPQSRVVHLVGQASGINDTKRPVRRRPAYWFDSRKRYFLKHHGRLYLLLADAAWISGFALWRIRRAVQRKPDTDPPSLLGDAIRHSGFLSGRGRVGS